MAKGILQFDLTDPDDREAFKLAQAGLDLSLAFQDVLNEVFRPRIKYGISEEEQNMDQSDLVSKIRDEIIAILEERDLLKVVY